MPSATLLQLPLEIRHIIYAFILGGPQSAEYHVVPPEDPFYRRAGDIRVAVDGSAPSALRVSRQVRKEFIDQVLANATFKMNCEHSYLLPHDIRGRIQVAHCRYLDSNCEKDIHTFKSLRRLTVEGYFNNADRERYGLNPKIDLSDWEPGDLSAMIAFGLNCENHWTLAEAGYSLTLEMFNDKKRCFKMIVLAHLSLPTKTAWDWNVRVFPLSPTMRS